MTQGDSWTDAQTTTVSANGSATIDIRPASGVNVVAKSLRAGGNTTHYQMTCAYYDFINATRIARGSKGAIMRGNNDHSTEETNAFLNNDIGAQWEFDSTACNSQDISHVISGVQHK